jgi:hypothetical protein
MENDAAKTSGILNAKAGAELPPLLTRFILYEENKHRLFFHFLDFFFDFFAPS